MGWNTPSRAKQVSVSHRPLVRENSVKIGSNFRGDTKTSRYKTIRKIGEGGQGKTELVERCEDLKRLIRKEQRFFEMHGNLPLESFLFENIIIPHPNIVEYDHGNLLAPIAGHKAGSLVMYFEYCEGGDLYEKVGNPKGSSERFMWQVLVQLADALAFLHYGYDRRAYYPDEPPRGWQRILHRDLKPDNVFFRRRPETGRIPELVLGDFGLAAMKTETFNYCGTANYLPPEVPRWTAKGDVWCLGAIIHALAHGHSPVKLPPIDRAQDQRTKIEWYSSRESRQTRELPDRYSEHLNDIMMDCLTRDPHDRISSRDLVRDVREKRYWGYEEETKSADKRRWKI